MKSAPFTYYSPLPEHFSREAFAAFLAAAVLQDCKAIYFHGGHPTHQYLGMVSVPVMLRSHAKRRSERRRLIRAGATHFYIGKV